MGSGTTCSVAKQFGRRFVGIELQESYYDLAVQNVTKTEVDTVPTPQPAVVGDDGTAGIDEDVDAEISEDRLIDALFGQTAGADEVP